MLKEDDEERKNEASRSQQMDDDNRRWSSLSPFLLVVFTSFIIYLVYLSIAGTSFTYNLIVRFYPFLVERGFWPLTSIAMWVISEISGNLGVYIRLAGGLFAFYSVFLLLRKKKIFLKTINRAIIFEAVHYLFSIPWILFLLLWSFNLPVFSQGKYVGISYLAQLLLVFPAMMVLSFKIRRYKVEESGHQVLKWVGIAAPLFVFSLWIKHALFWLYALQPNGANLNDLVQIIGFSNSMFTLLVAAVATLVVCLPLIQGKSKRLNSKSIGGILILIGSHFIVYDLIAIVVPVYLSFLSLTEFWCIVLPILGLGIYLKSGALSKNESP